MSLRDDVLKALEEARNNKLIGKASEAKLILYVNDDVKQLLNKLNTNVGQILMVSQLDVKDLADAPEDAQNFRDEVAIVVEHAQGETCERCRLISNDVGSDKDYPQFCARCAKIVRDNFPETATEGFED